ncbi:MAG TPA: hypothetical protein PLJ32_06980 [Kiritimatiellia bacterium]|nr:hypothetical protein [Kiritimatiellia bacterium]HOR97537.1 hypothetical protein [Kiritimatiellia bacterium]HPK37792.1 hypothetical protein [Kiritimatiellia bacterium]HPW75706.1 hypothetical protein [Kiritimatiellia bacterium]
MSKKPTQFDFWFAVNNTRIVVPPKRHLETFGNTIIRYHLVSELMDTVGKVRVREGRMQALRPQIITPSSYSTMILEGFGEQAQRYVEWLKEHEDTVRILRYGYTLKQEAFSEQVVSDATEAVLERVKAEAEAHNDPFAAVIHGVDDPWDVCLVRLFWTVIHNSAQENIRELHERRLFEMQDGIPAGLREEIERGFQAAAQDAKLIKPLGRLLQEHGLFERYQDRFFSLVQGKGGT